MSLVVVGLSHHTSPVALRERLAFTDEMIPAALARLRKRFEGAGVVLLSTCNRVEAYVHYAGGDAATVTKGVSQFLSEWHDIPEERFRDALYTHEGVDATGHLFRVASGLDSLVVGESQILGQVHDAYLAAQTEQTADKVIHALFQKAFATAKTVRTESGIGAGKVSVSSVAVDLAAAIFMDFSNTTVLVIGAGEMAELTLKSLFEKGARRVLVANRSIEHAQALADAYRGEAIALENISEGLAESDILITSTAAPGYILRPVDFEPMLRRRGQRPMFLIDIAVPRDIDPAVGDLANVYLYNMDDLERVVEQNLEARRQELRRCLDMIDRSARQFCGWMDSLVAEPTIKSMAEELNLIREEELEKTLAALDNISESQRREIRYLTERIVNRILQRPMREIKQEIGHHDPHTVLHLVKRIFGLED